MVQMLKQLQNASIVRFVSELLFEQHQRIILVHWLDLYDIVIVTH